MDNRTPSDLEPLLGTLARLFASEGAELEVAVLTYSTPEIVESHYDNWNGGTTYCTLTLHIPLKLFAHVELQKEDIEARMSERLKKVFGDSGDRNVLSSVSIRPGIVEDPEWREKSHAWLSGATGTNQRAGLPFVNDADTNYPPGTATP